MKTPNEKLTKIYTNCSGHMTNMATTPLYATPFKNLLQNQNADDLGTWYVAWWMWALPSLHKWRFLVDFNLPLGQIWCLMHLYGENNEIVIFAH